jgi:hypothetical protein
MGKGAGGLVNDLPDDYDQLTSIEKIENVHFPALKGGAGYRDTSPPSPHYNCLAWALGIDWTRYEPEKIPGYTWFPGVKREWSVEIICKIVTNHNYKPADNYDLVP